MGYDIERFKKPVNKELICPICTSVLEDPVFGSQCEHVFCRTCITEWLLEKQQCPIDTSVLKVEDLRSVSKIAKNMLASLLISCDYTSNGCSVFVKLEALDSHNKQCEYNPNFKVPKENNGVIHACKEEMDKHIYMEELQKGLNALTQNFELQTTRIQEIQESLTKSNQELKSEVNQLKEIFELTKSSLSNETKEAPNRSNQELKDIKYELQNLNKNLILERVQKAEEDKNSKLTSNENNLSSEWFEKIPYGIYGTNLVMSSKACALAPFLTKYRCPGKDISKFISCKCPFQNYSTYHECGIEKLEDFEDLIIRRDAYDSESESNVRRPCLILKADNTHVPSDLIPKCGFAATLRSTS